MDAYESIGVIKNEPNFDANKIDEFMIGINKFRKKGSWSKDDILKLYFYLLPNFDHKETGKYLDQRM